MKKLLAYFILIVFFSVPLMAQKAKDKKKAKNNKEEVEMPPPPVEEIKDVRIADTASLYQEGVKNEGFTKEDFFFNTMDTTAPPDDSLTWELRNFMNMTGALNLGVQFAKLMNPEKENDILPQEFYERMYKELTEGETRKQFENIVIKIYRKYFTLGDVENLIQFYSTETGKKTLAMMPSALTEVQKMSAGFGQMLGMKIYNDLLKEGKIK